MQSLSITTQSDERYIAFSEYDAIESLFHLTGENVSYGLRILLAYRKAGVRPNLTFSLNIGTERIKLCKDMDKKQCVSTGCWCLLMRWRLWRTHFSAESKMAAIWFHALQYTALIYPATYIMNLWHTDYLQGELLCRLWSSLILSRCEPSGGRRSASKAAAWV